MFNLLNKSIKPTVNGVMTKPTFKEILEERQEYLDALKSKGDLYALGFLESSFLYQMGDNGLEPLNPTQLETLAKWKATTQ